jgi:hypothetical protein
MLPVIMKGKGSSECGGHHQDIVSLVVPGVQRVDGPVRVSIRQSSCREITRVNIVGNAGGTVRFCLPAVSAAAACSGD